jgi:CubicO group peptidase (beta-lactamase class C family)
VLRGGQVVAEGAVGVRKLGDPTPITTTDAWYLGSETHTITATLAAVLVEQGKLAWSSTLGEVLGDLAIHALYKGVTLEALLAHGGGAPGRLPDDALAAMRMNGAPRARREEAVRTMLAGAPEVAPGTQVLVSDAGYLVASVMLERAAGASWEDLLRARVLEPLGMNGCRYEPLSTSAAVLEPWGHVSDGTILQPVAPGSATEPPPAFGPAGRLRCSLRDWAKLCALHLAGARHEATPLLGPPSFEKLQTPLSGTQALGWTSVSRPWSGKLPALNQASEASHANDGRDGRDGRDAGQGGQGGVLNASSFALVWLAPERDVGFLVVTNGSGPIALAAADIVVGKLVERFVAR